MIEIDQQESNNFQQQQQEEDVNQTQPVMSEEHHEESLLNLPIDNGAETNQISSSKTSQHDEPIEEINDSTVNPSA